MIEPNTKRKLISSKLVDISNEPNTKRVKIRVHKSAYTDVRTLYRNDLKEALKKQAKDIFKHFNQHCDGCSMCGTCMSEFKKRWLK